MPPTEKDQFIQNWEQEFQTTLKVLKAYPEGKLDFRPHETSRSARELAWVFNTEELAMIGGALKGNIDFSNLPEAPKSKKDMLAAIERNHRENVEKVKKMSDKDYNSMLKFFVGPGKMGDVRKADVFWMSVRDGIHHRGQFSVYLRMAGGKVPSIYGPSKDEPWM